MRKNWFLVAATLQIACALVFAVDVIIERRELTAHIWVELLGMIALTIGAAVLIDQYA